MAVLSLALPASGRLSGVLLVVGLAGASLFFGDAMITPAISVLRVGPRSFCGLTELSQHQPD
jgi:K+ transporter